MDSMCPPSDNEKKKNPTCSEDRHSHRQLLLHSVESTITLASTMISALWVLMLSSGAPLFQGMYRENWFLCWLQESKRRVVGVRFLDGC